MKQAVELVLTNAREYKAALDAADKQRLKAATTAAKVEGYRLMGELKKELKQGAPGGHQLAPLRHISKGSYNRKPGARMAKAVRYATHGTDGNSKVMVGFLQIKSSNAWIRIAQAQQEGSSVGADKPTPVGSTYRILFRRIGSHASKRIQRYYFLRGATKQLETPARPMIDPFWLAHKAEAELNVKSNFNRKMAGERI